MHIYIYIFIPCKCDIQNAPSKANLVLGRFMDRMQQRVVIATVGAAGGAPTGIATAHCGAVLMTDYPDPLCGGAFI